MSFIKKDINLGLLIIVLILAMSFASLGIYYNQNYTTLSKEYTSRLDSLTQVTDELFFYKNRLNRTATDLQVKKEDETELEKRYTSMKAENEQLTAAKAALEADLSSTKKGLLDTTNQLRAAQVEVLSQKSQIADLQTDRELWKAKSNSYKNKYEAVCAGDTGVC